MVVVSLKRRVIFWRISVFVFCLGPGFFLNVPRMLIMNFGIQDTGGGGPSHLVVHVKVNIQTFSLQYTLQITHFLAGKWKAFRREVSGSFIPVITYNSIFKLHSFIPYLTFPGRTRARKFIGNWGKFCMYFPRANGVIGFVSLSVCHVSSVQNPYYFPLYWLFNRDPYNGLLQSPYNWVV